MMDRPEKIGAKNQRPVENTLAHGSQGRKEAYRAFETSKMPHLNLRIETERSPPSRSPRIPLFQASFQPDNEF